MTRNSNVKIKPVTRSNVIRMDQGKKNKRHDRWVNEYNKFGGANDPITRTFFSRDYAINRQELENLYEGDWLARRTIEVPAKDATRKFIKFTGENEKQNDLMADEFDRLKVRDKVEEAIILSRLYGGNAMVIGAFDGQEVNTPLRSIKRVDFFNNVDRFLAYPMTFYRDPMALNFGDVETYQVMNLTVAGSQVLQVHESRVIRFDGAYLPQVLRVRNFGWGAPVLHNVFEALRVFGVSTQSGASVLQDFITKKIKIANLQELLATDKGQEDLIDRIQIMAQEMAINNIAVYGADEELDKMGTPLTGLPDMMSQFTDIVSAAVEIPKSRLFHNMSGKLGGDAGEADLRIHYDNIASYQNNRLFSRVRKIVDIIAEPHGIGPGEIDFEFLPLWELSELEEAKVRNEVADSDVKYINAGVLEPEEVALSRFAGDGIDIDNMTINVKRREDILKEIDKQPLLGEEPEPGEEEGGEEIKVGQDMDKDAEE